jgi:hypothetical protein
MATSCTRAAIVLIGCAATSCATLGRPSTESWSRSDPRRTGVIARAQVWMPTNVGAMNLKAGPQGPGAFAPGATVRCTYVEEKVSGRSLKFLCDVGRNDTVMVKFGQRNGEVYGEVLASRVLWALGFAADASYPVTVICRGCPSDLAGATGSPKETRFDPATIKRRKSGREWRSGDHGGWSWDELERVDPEAGGAPRAHRDALKLLAVFLQHTDSKPEQQRILCLGRESAECRRALPMMSDVGLTFGGGTFTNDSEVGSVNLAEWRRTPVWKEGPGCVGNLSLSFTGTLGDPMISEEGRGFLARRLVQLSDRQLHDLFDVARVSRRARSPHDPSSGSGTVNEWVEAFKAKRQEIVNRRCS